LTTSCSLFKHVNKKKTSPKLIENDSARQSRLSEGYSIIHDDHEVKVVSQPFVSKTTVLKVRHFCSDFDVRVLEVLFRLIFSCHFIFFLLSSISHLQIGHIGIALTTHIQRRTSVETFQCYACIISLVIGIVWTRLYNHLVIDTWYRYQVLYLIDAVNCCRVFHISTTSTVEHKYHSKNAHSRHIMMLE
jgi:hypothetical protein